MTVAQVGERPLPLAEQVAAARNAHPEGGVASVQPGAGDQTTRVVFSCPGARREAAHRLRRPVHRQGPGAADHLVRLHPGHHLAGRPAPQPAPGRGRPALLGARRELAVGHRARRGHAVVATHAAPPGPPPRHLLVPDLSAGKGCPPHPGLARRHRVWLTVGLLFLSATGLTWSRYAGANFGAGLDALDARAPKLSTALTARRRPGRHRRRPRHGMAGAGGVVESAAFDRVLTAARDGRTRRPGRDRPARRSRAPPGPSRRSTTPGRSAKDRSPSTPPRPRSPPAATSPTGRCWPN